jgi:CheY-like chemotaxis protein
MSAILVVDDDAVLRSLAPIILEQRGYQVLVAADGWQALQIAQQDLDPIDLLLTDLVMLGMDRAARLLCPAMRILYMMALAVAQLASQEIVLSERHLGLFEPAGDFPNPPGHQLEEHTLVALDP